MSYAMQVERLDDEQRAQLDAWLLSEPEPAGSGDAETRLLRDLLGV